MSGYSKINIIGRLQRWMDSEAGQTFLNYAYSWGASIVILGTLFKLTHMPSANFWLFLGMGTEVMVFFISAFDRPFKKETDIQNKEIVIAPQQPTSSISSSEIENMTQRIGMMPDTEENKKLKEVVNSIYDTYKQQLIKLNSQLDSIDSMEKQLKLQATYIGELNNIYGRMLDAIRAKE